MLSRLWFSLRESILIKGIPSPLVFLGSSETVPGVVENVDVGGGCRRWNQRFLEVSETSVTVTTLTLRRRDDRGWVFTFTTWSKSTVGTPVGFYCQKKVTSVGFSFSTDDEVYTSIVTFR